MRELLRKTDPAAGRELPSVDRFRMRAAIVSAARTAPVRSWRPYALAAVAVASLIGAVVLLRPAPRTAPAVVRIPEPSAMPAPAPAVAVETPRRHPQRAAHPRLARREMTGPPTRIVFTGPEGTRILWFVGTPDAKELGS